MLSERVCEATWPQIGIYGIWTALHERTCYLDRFNDKDVADTCRFGNSPFDFFFVLFLNAMKTIRYSNLLILENIIFTFEYFSTKDVLNN